MFPKKIEFSKLWSCN